MRSTGRRGVEGRVGELIGLEGGGYICVRNEVGWWMVDGEGEGISILRGVCCGVVK